MNLQNLCVFVSCVFVHHKVGENEKYGVGMNFPQCIVQRLHLKIVFFANSTHRPYLTYLSMPFPNLYCMDNVSSKNN
jgi:hypothetical protein